MEKHENKKENCGKVEKRYRNQAKRKMDERKRKVSLVRTAKK